MLDPSAALDADIHSAPKFSSLACKPSHPTYAQPSPTLASALPLVPSRDVRSSKGLSLCLSLLTF